jgi:transposase
LAEPVAILRCLRGIDTLSAVTVAAEVCDFRRFATAPAFMAFTGLVPSEHSSGAVRRQGHITKTGNRHVRRVLVEAAWTYRHRPSVTAALKRSSEAQPPEVIAYCWAAQLRLCAGDCEEKDIGRLEQNFRKVKLNLHDRNYFRVV